MDLLKKAKALAERVEAEAAKAKVPVAVCIVDVHGNLVLQHRMNGAPSSRSRSPSGRPTPPPWYGCAPPTSSRSCSRDSRSTSCLRSLGAVSAPWAAAFP
jgi:hypothetical protein